MNIGRHLRIVAATALLIGGLVHLQLYFEGYRSIDKIGPSFVANAIASGVIATALVGRRDWFVRLAGIGLAVSTVVAFIISHTGDGLFDFREHGLEPSPQALIALVVEISAVVLLAATFLPTVTDDGESSPRVLGVSTAIAAVALVGLGVYWSGHYDTDTKGSTDGVTIVDFSFAPASVTVAKGATVTWTNADAVVHSVVASDVTFNSDNLAQGTTFEHTFDTAGQFMYVCGIHSQMKGTITVTG
ncbi:MAG: cupredoxin family copper-binding protein [Ilumatobacteraceae bacterium]